MARGLELVDLWDPFQPKPFWFHCAMSRWNGGCHFQLGWVLLPSWVSWKTPCPKLQPVQTGKEGKEAEGRERQDIHAVSRMWAFHLRRVSFLTLVLQICYLLLLSLEEHSLPLLCCIRRFISNWIEITWKKPSLQSYLHLRERWNMTEMWVGLTGLISQLFEERRQK